MPDHLLTAHAGSLVQLLVPEPARAALRDASREWPSHDLSPRQLADLELLLNGGFSPLRGFMVSDDYESVCTSMRLADGSLWPIPITLDVEAETAQRLGTGANLALRDPEGVMLAVLRVREVFMPDRRLEAEALYGTARPAHPAVARLLGCAPPYCVAGSVEGLQPPAHHDFRALRLTPAELRADFERLGWRQVIGFQARGILHRSQLEFTQRVARAAQAGLLIHPVIGPSRPGEIDPYTRVRCYQALLPYYAADTARLALLPLATRLGGVREALWRAIIARNHGCTHLIVGDDDGGDDGISMAGPTSDAEGALQLLLEHEADVGVTAVPFQALVYVEKRESYVSEGEVPPEERPQGLSAGELRCRLAEGREVPDWFTPPEVAQELQRRYPPRHRQGFTVFLTGLSGSGKSTIANVLRVRFLEMGGRPVTLLDGDIVRKHLSSELGFSKEHRDLNIRRIGFVAAEITKNGGIAVCAPIAPYDTVRKEVRQMIEPHGGFFLVHVATPIEECEKRDRKGLYAKARAGIIKQFTGVSDPYEIPADAELVIDTTLLTPEEAARQILLHLERQGFFHAGRAGGGAPMDGAALPGPKALG